MPTNKTLYKNRSGDEIKVINRKDDDTMLYQFVISDETRDRHGTVIKMSAWNLDNYNKNGIVLYMHDSRGSDPDKVIGKGRAFVDGGKLIGEVEFEPADINELAEKVRKKVEFGSLSATSVGFRSTKGHWGNAEQAEDEDTYYFDAAELYEFSVVGIPSNPNALKRSEGMDDFIKSVRKEEEDDNESGMSDHTKTKLSITETKNRALLAR